MDPIQPSQDLVSWLVADWRRALVWAALVLVPVALRVISAHVGSRCRPEVPTLWTRVLERLSGAVWADAPGSVKGYLAAMPSGCAARVEVVPVAPAPAAVEAAPRVAADETPTSPERGTRTPEGGWRSGTTDPQISGSFNRITGPQPVTPKPPGGVLPILIGFLFAFGSGCATSAIDKARLEFARVLKAQTAIQSRYKLQNREFQRKNIERIGVHTPAAAQWQSEWITKKAPVEEQIRRCQGILDEASDFLLLSDDKRGLATVANAIACVSAEKDMIGKLFDGGL